MTVESIWSEFRGGLRAFLARRLRDPDDVEDLLQEVFLRIHRAGGSPLDAERLPAWLYRTTRNVLIDFYRSRAAAGRHLTRGVAIEPAEAVGGADAAQDEEALAACLAPLVERLPEPYREAIRLTAIGGASQVEVARRIGVSTSGMKSRVQRGRRLLRDLVLACCEVDMDRRGGVAKVTPRGGTCSSCDTSPIALSHP